MNMAKPSSNLINLIAFLAIPVVGYLLLKQLRAYRLKKAVFNAINSGATAHEVICYIGFETTFCDHCTQKKQTKPKKFYVFSNEKVALFKLPQNRLTETHIENWITQIQPQVYQNKEAPL